MSNTKSGCISGHEYIISKKENLFFLSFYIDSKCPKVCSATCRHWQARHTGVQATLRAALRGHRASFTCRGQRSAGSLGRRADREARGPLTTVGASCCSSSNTQNKWVSQPLLTNSEHQLELELVHLITKAELCVFFSTSSNKTNKQCMYTDIY